jgi:hypothetical protein
MHTARRSRKSGIKNYELRIQKNFVKKTQRCRLAVRIREKIKGVFDGLMACRVENTTTSHEVFTEDIFQSEKFFPGISQY